jgi:hypothetical protein
VGGAGELGRDPVDRHGTRSVEQARCDECACRQSRDNADGQHKQHRHEYELGRDGRARADLELDARDGGVDRDVEECDRDGEGRTFVQEDRTEGRSDQECEPKPSEGEACAALELLLVHARASLPHELTLDFARPRGVARDFSHHRRTIRGDPAVFPSFKGRPGAFFHPKG